MKIAIDLRLLGRGTRSGIEEYTEELTNRLILAPHHFNLFYNGRQMAPLPPIFSRKNVSITNWKIPNKIFEVSSRMAGRPSIDADAVFSPHFNFLKTSSPHLMTFHDLSFLHHPDFFSTKQRLWHWLQLYKTQAKKTAHIIAVSEFTKSDLINFLNIPAEKISVIHSGISDILKPASINDPRFDFPFILYLGTLEPRKNIPALIRAWNIIKQKSLHKDLRLVLAGSPGWLYQNILKEAGRSPHKEQIIFTGPVASRDRVMLYNKCIAFAYPSFFEGFGFPPLEAQKCGAPVVASDRTSIPEILGDSALLVNPWQVGDLAEKLMLILENPSERERLKKLGSENAAKFSWEKASEKTLNLLNIYGRR